MGRSYNVLLASLERDGNGRGMASCYVSPPGDRKSLSTRVDGVL